MTMHAHIRTYELAGGHNFRDLGGYPTADGRMVAWERVFRSGTLANLTDADHAALRDLGVAFICDFRTNRERTHYPSNWMPDGGTETWIHDHERSSADLVSVIAGPRPDPDAARALIVDLYRQIPYDQAKAYGELLRRIADDQLPVLFHCSAGKDRTGVFGGVLLDLLGVERETILRDYAMSDEHYDALFQMFLRDRRIHDFETVDPERIAPLLRADPDYLTTTFAHLDAEHGGTEAYVRDVLGIDAEALARIRANLLVPA